jgi:benzoyl-CoA 2,3-dioxygenase component A
MESGVIDAFRDVCRSRGFDWDAMQPALLAKGRLHIETY